MRLSHAVQAGAWGMILLNLLTAFGAIAVFARMSPAIALIIERNERSLEAAEQMLTCLARAPDGADEAVRARFHAALDRARGNVTEPGEAEALAVMQQQAEAALGGAVDARADVIAAIASLTDINRLAMHDADARARQLGNAGAWGVVLMSICVFVVAMAYVRAVQRRIVMPLAEIHDVVVVQHRTDHHRRCGGAAVTPDVRAIYSAVNELLDAELEARKRDGSV